MQLHDERIDLLIACLKFSNSHEELATLRGTLMAEPEMLDCLLRTSDRRFMNAALVDGLGTKGILHPATPAPDKPMSTRTRLGQIRQIHEERRAAQTSALKVILSELNDQGIEPLLVKGAVSLLTGKPSWRFQRDLDFAIHPDEVERTTDVLKQLGFRILKEMGQSHHHLDSMFHDDLGVAVEPHLRINGPRAARAVRGLPMMSSAVHAEVDCYKVRMLRPEYALLHGLVHHHFENRGGIYGLIGLKGLLEFAYALETLDEETIAELNIVLQRAPRLAAATELWIAASRDWLGTTIPAALEPGSAANSRLANITHRLSSPHTASMVAACYEDMAGVASVMSRNPIHAWRHVGALLSPVYDIIGNRPWSGRPRAMRAAGLLAFS